LLQYELANVCFVKCKRHPEQHRVLLEAFRHRLDFDLEYVEVDLDGTLRLAIETGLTAYDASYLWLARYLPAELVTLDRQLIRELPR
jgi:predicted nucleic acid-binding protein